MHHAIVLELFDFCLLLIRAGIDIHTRDYEGCTILHYTQSLNNPEFMQELINLGANVNTYIETKYFYSVWGNSPLHIAAINKCYKSIKLLIDNGADIDILSYIRSPICYSAEIGDIHGIKLFLELGSNIKQLNLLGESILTQVIQSEFCNEEMIQFLLDKGIHVDDIHEKDEEDNSLIRAVTLDKINIVQLLLVNGALTSHCNYQGCTALFFAFKNKNEEMIKLLLQYMPDSSWRIQNIFGKEAPDYWHGDDERKTQLLKEFIHYDLL